VGETEIGARSPGSAAQSVRREGRAVGRWHLRILFRSGEEGRGRRAGVSYEFPIPLAAAEASVAPPLRVHTTTPPRELGPPRHLPAEPAEPHVLAFVFGTLGLMYSYLSDQF